ncbi:MAG: GLUG motif-containing protein [Candidatus Gastranaerophilaceae bacterium]|nr:GLUG motif-containing protein [Candidatus Gastranaerophilaceae bacterium]
MGMSASQARLLYLTAQLNNLSLKGQNVSDAKARLALDTQAIQDKYIKALNSSRLMLNSNIFATDGSVFTNEYITLDNLAANGYKVSDGSKILGYKWENIPTGEKELIEGPAEPDYTKPIYPMKEVETDGFVAPSATAIGDAGKMQNIVNSLGLTTNDLDVQSYKTIINGQEKEINAIVIKSQNGFNKVYETLQNEATSGVLDNALQQNYAFDVEEVNMSAYKSTGIPFFQGIFDGNGVTLTGLDGSQGLFRDVYGVVKNVNIKGANIKAEKDSLGAIAGYLGEGGLIENCNVTDINITCNLENKEYEEGYDSERAGVGGIVGYNNGSIRNTSAQGQIYIPRADESFGYIGGFAGANVNSEYGSSKNVIENCYSDVNIRLSSSTNYSNSINGFIGDDTYEALINNCISLGSILTSNGNAINGTDLANWGPVIESNVTNLMALDTRNNNDVMYWENQVNPSFVSGSRTQPPSLSGATTTLSDGSQVYTWLNAGAAGYNDQNQLSAINNNLPVLNLTAIQSEGLSKTGSKQVPDTDAEPIGYQYKKTYIEVDKFRSELVLDPDFKITSLELEEGLRSGAYTLVKPADKSTTQTILLNGVYYDTISLSCCSIITDEAQDELIEKAEAEYNRDMQEIQMQDKRYEMDQKKIDTEYNACLSEEESIKNVLSKNVERSFKTFG